jgi:hypothetical protein
VSDFQFFAFLGGAAMIVFTLKVWGMLDERR